MSLSIDDVDYLKSKGSQESYLAVVDSAKRDKTLFPSANSYEAVFTQPFLNACSISLIGAKIPRTMYLLDVNNNVLTYRVGADSTVFETLTLTPGDYKITDLVAALNAGLNGITVSVVPLQNRLSFSGPDEFCFDMTSSSMRGVLGFSEMVDITNKGYTVPSYYISGSPSNPLSHDVFVSVPAPGAQSVLFSGPRPLTPSGYPAATTRMTFSVAASGQASTLQLLYTSTAALSLPVQVADESGVVVASSTMAVSVALTPEYASAAISCTLFAGVSYTLSFPTTITIVQLYADDLTSFVAGVQAPQLQFLQGDTWVASSDPTACLCCAVQDVGISTSQQLLAPGVYDLTGVRYVTIQCRELTSHLFRSRAFDRWTAGMGVVDLGVYGYQNQSYDYASYPPREFHPCTVRKLSLSFECPDGSLYDFKGIDHLLTFIIRYYKPADQPGQVKMLNRLYEPDPSKAWTEEHQEQARRRQEAIRRGIPVLTDQDLGI